VGMAWVAVGLVVIVLVAGYRVVWMLRQPADRRYRDPREGFNRTRAIGFGLFPIIFLIGRAWFLAVVFAVVWAFLLWFLTVDRDYWRHRTRRR